MEIKLNFKLGDKTPNGRYYAPDMLTEQFDKLLTDPGHIIVGPDVLSINEHTGQVDKNKVVGIVNSYRVDEENNVWFDVSELSEGTIIYITQNPDKVKLTLYGFGVMDENKIIQELTLASLFTTID